MPYQELCDHAVLATLISSFSEQYPAANRAAIASQWSMDFLCVLLPATLVPLLAGGLALQAEKDLFAVFNGGKWSALATEKRPVHLPHQRLSQYLDQLLDRQVEPLFKSLSALSGLASKVFWTNFVAVWDSIFARISLGKCDHDYLQSAQQWMEQAWVPTGRRHLRELQRFTPSPVSESDKHWLLRSHCCLHFQLCEPHESAPLCEACPKLRRQPLADQVRYLAQLRVDNISG